MSSFRIHIRPGSKASRLGLTAVSVWDQWPQEGRSPQEDGKDFGEYLVENGDPRFVAALAQELYVAMVVPGLPESGQKCSKCDATAVVMVGADKTPYCQEDFNRLVEEFGETLRSVYRGVAL